MNPYGSLANQSNRIVPRPYEQLASRPKPRQSQPPMLSNDPDFMPDVVRSVKQIGSHNAFQPKLYKAFDPKPDSGSRHNLSGYTGNHDYPKASVQQLFSQHNQDQGISRLHPQTSPKTDPNDWHNPKYTHTSHSNRSMPLSSSGGKIDKNAYLKCNEQIKGGGDGYARKESADLGHHQYEPTFGMKGYGDIQELPLTKTGTQLSPARKAPRMSQPNFPTADMDYHFGGLGTANNSSPIRDHPPRFTPYQNEAVFKKQKDVPMSYASTATSFRHASSLRRSEFRATDFIRGKELGNGKFGTVEVVKHKTTGFVCAMKTVPKSIIKEQNIVNQFIRELKIQSYLDHPNITKLYGFFEDRDFIYLLLELGSQGQLYRLIKQRGKVSENTCVFIMKQICDALKYLHNMNILHRDIKPQNIVVTYGTVKLCDFGWAVNKIGTQLRSTFCGTPLYVSPEILKGQQYDQKIDIWSIGILAYQLIVGDIPFQISNDQQLIKIIKDDIVFPKDIVISDQAKDFILKILKKNPQDRLKVDKLLEHPFLQRNVELNDTDL